MKRSHLSRACRMRVFERADGLCCLCGLPIACKAWVCEHMKPLWLGGVDDETNLGPAHERCAASKTKTEAPVRAKVWRVRQKHLGIRKRQRRPMMGTVASGWRKRMDGTVERR
jgi:5-methylcytosine-specific restriction endonuclease McrA